MKDLRVGDTIIDINGNVLGSEIHVVNIKLLIFNKYYLLLFI